MVGLGLVVSACAVAQEAQDVPAVTDNLPVLRIAVRAGIAALIALLITYIVIEQVGSWRRRRSGRD